MSNQTKKQKKKRRVQLALALNLVVSICTSKFQPLKNPPPLFPNTKPHRQIHPDTLPARSNALSLPLSTFARATRTYKLRTCQPNHYHAHCSQIPISHSHTKHTSLSHISQCSPGSELHNPNPTSRISPIGSRKLFLSLARQLAKFLEEEEKWNRYWRERWSTRSSTGSNLSPEISSSCRDGPYSFPIQVIFFFLCLINAEIPDYFVFLLGLIPVFLCLNLAADINGDALHSSVGLPPALNVATAKVGKLEIVVRH